MLAAKRESMRIARMGVVLLLAGWFPGRECVREVRCVEACGGEETTAGCGPCPDGTFDSIECEDPVDAGGDANVCAPLGAGCDAVECCGGGDCCLVFFDGGGAGGYLCVEPGTGGADCI